MNKPVSPDPEMLRAEGYMLLDDLIKRLQAENVSLGSGKPEHFIRHLQKIGVISPPVRAPGLGKHRHHMSWFSPSAVQQVREYRWNLVEQAREQAIKYFHAAPAEEQVGIDASALLDRDKLLPKAEVFLKEVLRMDLETFREMGATHETISAVKELQKISESPGLSNEQHAEILTALNRKRENLRHGPVQDSERAVQIIGKVPRSFQQFCADFPEVVGVWERPSIAYAVLLLKLFKWAVTKRLALGDAQGALAAAINLSFEADQAVELLARDSRRKETPVPPQAKKRNVTPQNRRSRSS